MQLDPDVLFVDDGDVLTSAGVAAGIDLCLHVVRRDHGSEVANRAARRCVVPPWRDGGQAQFIERPVPPVGEASTAAARAWALQRLAEPLEPGRAGRPGPDERAHLHPAVPRGDRAEPGRSGCCASASNTPGSCWRAPICRVDKVAAQAGFGTAASLRQHLHAAVGVLPAGLPAHLPPRRETR